MTIFHKLSARLLNKCRKDAPGDVGLQEAVLLYALAAHIYSQAPLGCTFDEYVDRVADHLHDLVNQLASAEAA